MLVSSFYKVVAFNIIAVGTLGGIVLLMLYCDFSSEYVMEPYA